MEHQEEPQNYETEEQQQYEEEQAPQSKPKTWREVRAENMRKAQAAKAEKQRLLKLQKEEEKKAKETTEKRKKKVQNIEIEEEESSSEEEEVEVIRIKKPAKKARHIPRPQVIVTDEDGEEYEPQPVLKRQTNTGLSVRRQTMTQQQAEPEKPQSNNKDFLSYLGNSTIIYN